MSASPEYDRALFLALSAKRDELSGEVQRLSRELAKVEEGMRSVCEHRHIERGTYTFDHDSYSQTWNEGPTFKCVDCGLYERGWGGVLEIKSGGMRSG